VERDGGESRSDLGQVASEKFGKTEIFLQGGLDRPDQIDPPSQFADVRNEATDRGMG
jgi:hypothetical protein